MPEDFKKHYQTLAARQKEAVDYLEGPLLVIAGPGTGKTQLIGLRTANILIKTDALPENILCLTFTESGAQEMRQRLINIIGEEAYKITISTYHGFGSEIIRRNPNYFSGNLRPINELKIDSLIRQLQDQLPHTSSLKSPQMLRSIVNLIADAKATLLSPLDIRRLAKANLKYIQDKSVITKSLSTELSRVSKKALPNFRQLLENGNEPKAGCGLEPLGQIFNDRLAAALEDVAQTNKTTSLARWKAKFLTRDDSDQIVLMGQNVNERLVEFSNLYEKYIKSLATNQLYDYEDMILRAIEALKKHNELRFNLQEQYQYIMLDEYQDTNLAQAELIYLLTNNSASEGRPNIMAVGDDDQAIFSFQGARHSNMLDFTNQYLDVKRITLVDNYRSAQLIIDLSSMAASQIKERLSNLIGAKKEFKAVTKKTGHLQSLVFANEVSEYAWLAKHLKEATGQVAVIAPQHKYLERASAYLREAGLDISYERRENILDDPIINQLLTILELLIAINDKDNRLADSLLSIVLNYDFWRLDTELIWRLSWQSHDSHQPWLTVMLKNPATKPLALLFIKLAVNAKAYRYDFIIDQVLGLSDIKLMKGRLKAVRSPFMAYYKDDLLRAALFQQLIVIKEQFSDFNLDNTRPLLISDLISFINELRLSNTKLTNDFNYDKQTSRVKLLTAHAAKGQEFDGVYLLSFINEAWGPKTNHNTLNLPPNLTFIVRRAEDTDDERLRLLYVALTRAKTSITTLSYNQDVGGRSTTPLNYLALKPKVLSNESANLRPLWQKENKPMMLTTDLKLLLEKRLENYSLNPTQLNTFLDVRHQGPQDFYTRVLLKYQQPSRPRMEYGSAIHDSLNWLQQGLTNTGRLPKLESLLNEFEKQLTKHRLTAQDFNHLKEQGRLALSHYYKANQVFFSSDDLSEHDFKGEGLVIGGVRLTGKVDKLVINKNKKTINIIDYKTGHGSNRWLNNPKLHLYKNQLYFYRLLSNNSAAFKDYVISQGVLDFVEPQGSSNSLYKLTLDYDDQDMDRFINLIKVVWRHINDLNFPDISQYKPNLAGLIAFEDDLINGRI